MTLVETITFIAISIGLIGSIFFLKSFRHMSPDATSRLSGARTKGSLDLIVSLSMQRAEGMTGASLFIVSLILVLINRFELPSLNLNRGFTSLIILLFAFSLYWLAQGLSDIISERHKKAAGMLILRETLVDLFGRTHVVKNDVDNLSLLNQKLLKLELPKEGTPFEKVQLLAKEVGILIPEEISIQGRKI